MQSPTLLSPHHHHQHQQQQHSSSNSVGGVPSSTSAQLLTTMFSHLFDSPRRWMEYSNNNILNKNETMADLPPQQELELEPSSIWQWIVQTATTSASSIRGNQWDTPTELLDNDDTTDGSFRDDDISSTTIATLSSIITIGVALFLAFGLHTLMMRLPTNRRRNDDNRVAINNNNNSTNDSQQQQQQQQQPESLTNRTKNKLLQLSPRTCNTTNGSSSSSSSSSSIMNGKGTIHAPMSPPSDLSQSPSLSTDDNNNNHNKSNYWHVFSQQLVIQGILNSISIAARVYIGLMITEFILDQCPSPSQQQQHHILLSHVIPSFLFSTFVGIHSHNNNNSNHNQTHSNNENSHSNTTASPTSNSSTSTTPTTGTTTSAAAASFSREASVSSLLGSFRLRAAAPMVAQIVCIGMTIISIKRIILLQQQQQQRGAVVSVPSNNNHTNYNAAHTTTASTTTTIPKISGRMILLNRLFDIIIYGIMAVYIIHEISIDTTTSHRIVQSLLSAGGIGALIFSFASKDLATEIVGGVALGMYDILHVGDRVRIDSTLAGKVIEIGFVETTIQSYDNIITRVPNSQLTKSRISNLSRCPRSRLRQNIRIKYSDIDKLPALLHDIKEEIILSCPKVISDGSKSFHTVMSSFEADHIQVMILAHFDIAPVTAEFIRNRHDVLFAIHRAMKKHDMAFAIPPIVFHTTANSTTTTSPSKNDPADYSY